MSVLDSRQIYDFKNIENLIHYMLCVVNTKSESDPPSCLVTQTLRASMMINELG